MLLILSLNVNKSNIIQKVGFEKKGKKICLRSKATLFQGVGRCQLAYAVPKMFKMLETTPSNE